MTHRRLALLFLFVAAAGWIALLGIAKAIEQTSWGHSGHPSIGFVLVLFSYTTLPIFGLAGCSYAIARKARSANPMRFAAVVISICVFLLAIWAFVVFRCELLPWSCYPYV